MQLVCCFVVWKGVFEFVLPLSVTCKGDSRTTHSFCCQVQHVCCHVRDCLFCRLFLSNPCFSADLSQPRSGFGSANVFLDQIDTGDGDKDFRSFGKLKLEVLFGVALFGNDFETTITGNAMCEMNDEITLSQIQKTIDGFPKTALG